MESYTGWPLGSGFFRSAKCSGRGAVCIQGSSLFLLRSVHGELPPWGRPFIAPYKLSRLYTELPGRLLLGLWSLCTQA